MIFLINLFARPYPSQILIMSLPEPLLYDDPNRFVMMPIKYHEIWNFYKKAISCFWVADDIDLSHDLKDWEEKLKEEERYFIKNILAFFAASDGIVNENLINNFCQEIKIPEVRAFYGFQQAMENIHGEMYSLLIDKYVSDPQEKESLFRALETMPVVANKASWAFKYMNPDANSFAGRLVGFACVEGILFSGSFCAIFWLKKRGLMPGLCSSNKLISKDEGLHCDFACLLYRDHVVNKLPPREVQEIIRDAVVVECEFVTRSLPSDLIGMNSDLMVQYIKMCADRLCIALGVPKIYNVVNPFDWMELISIDGKENFFETRNVDYSRAVIDKVFMNNEAF